MFSGNGVVGVSLPIRIFEPRSLCERISDIWGFSHAYLDKASNINNNPLERFKLVITFVISGLHLMVNPNKPFNPILGETY